MSQYDREDRKIKLDMIGGEYLLTVSRMSADQDSLTMTMRRIDEVDADVGQQKGMWAWSTIR